MFKSSYFSKSNLSLSKFNSHSVLYIFGYWNKIKHRSIYGQLKAPYIRLRTMLENDTANTYSKNEEISDYKMHINLIILIAIIIACLVVLISSIFLIKYLYKKYRKKKEEEENKKKKENEKDINSKKTRKYRMTYEMSNIYSSGKNFFRNSTPMRKNKTFSLNPLLSSIKLRNSCKVKLNVNNEDKIINNNNDEEKKDITPKINNEYSQYTFSSNSEISKDSDIKEVVDNL